MAFVACGEDLLACHDCSLPFGAPQPELIDSILTIRAVPGMSRDQVRDGFSVARYDNGFAVLYGAQQFCEASFGLSGLYSLHDIPTGHYDRLMIVKRLTWVNVREVPHQLCLR